MIGRPTRSSIAIAWAFIATSTPPFATPSNARDRYRRRRAAAEAGSQGTAERKPQQRSGGHRQKGKAEDAVGECKRMLGVGEVGDPAAERRTIGEEDPGHSETRARHTAECILSKK